MCRFSTGSARAAAASGLLRYRAPRVLGRGAHTHRVRVWASTASAREAAASGVSGTWVLLCVVVKLHFYGCAICMWMWQDADFHFHMLMFLSFMKRSCCLPNCIASWLVNFFAIVTTSNALYHPALCAEDWRPGGLLRCRSQHSCLPDGGLHRINEGLLVFGV